MSLIADTLISHLPFRRRQTPSGWISFNAVCCNDQRNRGGVIQDGEAVSYHCFNCGFKASWQPGRSISVKIRKILQLLNVDDATISKLQLEAIRHLSEGVPTRGVTTPTFIPRSLPRGAEPILSYLNDLPEKLLPILEYIYSRSLTVDDYNFYWTPEEGFDDRLIIPFYYKGITVGYTARSISQSKSKYLSEQQPGYVFNLDRQNHNRQFVIVCEGPFDAISIDGVAVLGSEISQQQTLLIKQLQREVIVVPDRDQAGTKLIEQAILNSWSVSLPNWEVKDINDAVIKYGKLNTLMKIRQNSHTSEIKIKLLLKEWLKNEYVQEN
jgi:5S rRNA maturation endonuclease (ribonuclease M5)